MKQILIGVIISCITCTSKNNINMNQHCDTETGVCTPSELTSTTLNKDSIQNTEIIYVGDPMCSWCYGIAPELKKLKYHYDSIGIPFTVIVGGLRPGGGDQWDDNFKEFLKNHWIEIEERTNQPFGFDILKLDSFNYDTEPSCRAYVTAKPWLTDNELAFFEAIQTKFYYKSEDPTTVEFYNSICTEFNIPFDEFKTKFESKALKEATHKEFLLNRSWGVRAYPTILLSDNNQKETISRGYSTFETLKEKIDSFLNE